MGYVSDRKHVKGRPRAKAGRSRQKIPGTMNRLEARYAEHLETRRIAGQIAAYWYESMKFRLADKTWYTPDFMVMLADGELQLHETKGGFVREDAIIKLKITSATYWCFRVFRVTEGPVRQFTLAEIAS